jgi:hypothetical protein
LLEALGAPLRHQKDHLAQPVHPQGSGRRSALAHQRAPEGFADEIRR